MSRSVVWSRTARADLRLQLAYISDQSQKSAVSVSQRITERIAKLAHMPTGHRGRVDGTFEAGVQLTSLIVVYRLLGNEKLQIVRIIHTSRHWQKGEWPAD